MAVDLRRFCMGLAGIVLWLLFASPVLWAASQLLPPEALPDFSDDLHWHDLEKSLQESLAYLDSLPPERRFALAGERISPARLKKTLRSFLALLEKRPDVAGLRQALQRDFLVYRVLAEPSATSPDNARSPLLLTGYFQPILQASRQRKPPYIHPLYAPPKSLVQRKDKDKIRIGRWHRGRLVPFWTRREIEQGGFLAGEELLWLRDPFDAFIVHVQGSALVRFQEDGSIEAVRFAARNGHPYTSIGSYLVREGRMRKEEVSLESLRRYLKEHPQEQEHILHQNDSYIFFAWDTAGPTRGSLNRPLTPGRSVAADQTFYPPGLLLFVRSSIPQIDQGRLAGRFPLRRFVSVQDSGAAIKGPHRLDLFCGTGKEASLVAGEMKESGELYLILSKER